MDSLTAEMQNHAKATALIDILYEQTQKDAQNLPNTINTMAGRSAELNKEWSNTTTFDRQNIWSCNVTGHGSCL